MSHLRLDVFGMSPLVDQKACVGVELELVLMPASFSGPYEVRGKRAGSPPCPLASGSWERWLVLNRIYAISIGIGN